MTTLDGLLKQIGFGFKQARLASKLSVRGFCRKTDQESTNYASIESGRRCISLKKLVTLAEQHNCDVIVTIVSKDMSKEGWARVSSK